VNRPKYRAFLSYSHRDSRWAGWLHRSIESYRPPRNLVGTESAHGVIPKRLSPVFRDREELASATDLGTVISEALSQSACQIVICSPQSAKSKWVNEEILAFKRLGRENRIFCLIIGGEPNATDMPGREGEECFPPALRFKIDANGNLSDTRTEPIAADARPGKDGKNNAKLKLIAGVLGVGFDSLRRREQQRRNRQLFLIACASLAGMVVTTGLAGYALVQRKAAERQTARAESEAETARQTTNFLVDLFKISDPSEARGNTVTAREMLDKGAARIDKDLAKQPAIRATLMDTVGTVYMGLGLYGQARRSLDGAVATRRSNDAANPQALAVSLEHQGDLLTLQADYGAAEKAYRDAIAILSARPDDRQAQVELAKTLYGLGWMYDQKGNYDDADRSLREALKRQHKLYGSTHGEIARTQKVLAKVIAEKGDLNSAITLMRDVLGMQRELRGTEPHPDLAEAINDLAVWLEERGDYDEAEKLYIEAIAMKRRLLGDKHPEIAMGLANLAGALEDKGDLAGAESNFRQALAMQRELLGEVHPDVASTLNNLAFVQYARGDTRGALATERESLAVYEKLFPGDNPDVARIMNRIGFWLTLAGQYPEAEKDLQTSLAMRRRLVDDSHPDVATSLMHLAILQVAQRKYDDAVGSSRRAVEILSSALSATHWKTAVAESAEGAALTGLGRYSEAEPLLAHSLGILGKDTGAPPEYHRLAQRYLDTLHVRTGTAAGVSRTSSAAPDEAPVHR
jgi:tetratricopeptide (TPR) repeat protein